LEKQYRDLGRELRNAKLAAGPELRQKGESALMHHRRAGRFDEEQKQRRSRIWQLQYHRKAVKQALEQIDEGDVPVSNRAYELCAEAAVLGARYDAAYRAALDRWQAEVYERLTGDIAWQKELERRAEIAEAGNPAMDMLIRRWAQREDEPGPRVGDFLRVGDECARITRLAPDRDQLYAEIPRDDDHHCPCLFRYEDPVKALSAGGRRHRLQDIVATNDVRDGLFWFQPFKEGIRFTAPCRVFQLAGAVQDDLTKSTT
jgi:hypothetical protein